MVKFVNKSLLNIFPYDTIRRGTRLIQANRVTGKIPLVTAGAEKQGVSAYIQKNTELFKSNSITIDMFGNVFYRNYNFFADDNIIVLHSDDISQEAMLYLASVLNKTLSVGFSYGKQFRMQSLKFVQIQVPVTPTGELDTAYMASYVQKIEASYVQKIEAYLAVLGYKSLADCKLNEHDLDVLHNKPKKFVFFKLNSLFTHIKQGKRLRKQDQISGNIPFIMSGETNQGFVKFIKNNLNLIPKNSLTIDILGNVFYRNYEYSISDDVGAYWSEKYTTNQMLYLTTSIKLAMLGKFSYGKKFRSSRSNNINVALPVTTSGKPDYAFMEDYITAIEKLKVIKIKQYLDQKLLAYQELTK